MFYISADIGTTNLKLSLFDEEKNLIQASQTPYQKIVKDDERYELDVEEIESIFLDQSQNFIEQLAEDADLAIILTTAMHSLIILDEDFQTLSQLITWNDKRGRQAIKDMDPLLADEFYHRTGTPIHPMNPFYKLLSLKKERTDWSNLRFASLKDYLFYRLTGKWWIDVANASASGLYSLQDQDWDAEILDYLNIQTWQLPTIHWSQASAKLTALSPERKLTVYLGTSDGAASNLSFSNLPHAKVISFGTSHAVRFMKDKPELNAEIQQFCYQIDPKSYLIGLPSNNAGNVLQWILEIFESSYAELAEILSSSLEPKGVFLPYLNGERSPLWDNQAKGHYFDLTAQSDRQQVIFDMVCGLIFNIKLNSELLEKKLEKNPVTDKIALVGRITNFMPMLQVMADIFNLPIYYHEDENAETLGALALISDDPLEVTYHKVTAKHPEKFVDGYIRFKQQLHIMLQIFTKS